MISLNCTQSGTLEALKMKSQAAKANVELESTRNQKKEACTQTMVPGTLT